MAGTPTALLVGNRCFLDEIPVILEQFAQRVVTKIMMIDMEVSCSE